MDHNGPSVDSARIPYRVPGESCTVRYPGLERPLWAIGYVTVGTRSHISPGTISHAQVPYLDVSSRTQVACEMICT